MEKYFYFILNKISFIILIVLTVLGLILWLGFPSTKDFGLNFMTEMLGALITIYVIDRLIKNMEKLKSIPQRLAAYEDVRLYTSRYISFWLDAYRASVPEEDPPTITEFFSKNGLEKVFKYLYLDAKPNVIPPRTWECWIVENASEFKTNGDKILDRHSYNLDPNVYGFLHHLTEGMFNNMLMSIPSLHQSDLSMNFPRVRTLGYYSIPPQGDDLSAILGLYNWCENEFNELKKFKASVKQVFIYQQRKNKDKSPKSMIPVDIFDIQIKSLRDFREKNK